MKKKFRVRNKGIFITAIIICALIIYGIFFNGRGFIYISGGVGDDTALTAGGERISTGAANVFLADEKSVYKNVADTNVLESSLNGETVSEYIMNSVKGSLSKVLLLNIIAKNEGVVLSSLEENNARLAASAYMQSISAEDKEKLAISDKDAVEIFKQYAIAVKTAEKLTDKKTEEVSVDDARVISVQLIKTDSEDIIKQAKSRLERGETFFEVAADIDKTTDFSFDIKRGETDETFEAAAFALKSGEVSDIIQTGNNFYIIKCSSDNEEAKTEANLLLLKEEKREKLFNETYLPVANSVYVDLNNGFWQGDRLLKLPDVSTSFMAVYDAYVGI